MKQFIMAAAISLLSISTQAQNSGTITYEEIIKLDIELDGEMAQFAAMLPKEQKGEKQLYFSATESVYKNKEKSEEEQANTNVNGMQVMIKMDRPDEVLYKDLQAGKTYEQKEFMGRKFLITGDVKKYSWKMTGKQKEISGYPCQEAITAREKDTVIVWFTPAIPVATGPGSLGNLPGLILEASVGKQLTISAKEIAIGEVDKEQLSKPKGGKKITSEEYEKVVAEKTAEMQEQYGGNGQRVIIHKQIR